MSCDINTKLLLVPKTFEPWTQKYINFTLNNTFIESTCSCR